MPSLKHAMPELSGVARSEQIKNMARATALSRSASRADERADKIREIRKHLDEDSAENETSDNSGAIITKPKTKITGAGGAKEASRGDSATGDKMAKPARSSRQDAVKQLAGSERLRVSDSSGQNEARLNSRDETGKIGGGMKRLKGQESGRVALSGGEEEYSAADDSDSDSASTTSTPRDAASGEVRCEIQIVTNHPVGSTSASWNQRRYFFCSNSMKVADFDRRIRNRLIGMLEEDGFLLDMAQQEDWLLSCQIRFLVPHCGEDYYQPTESKHHLEKIGDLVENPSGASLSLKVDVLVAYSARPANVVNQLPYKFNADEGKKVPAGDLVVEKALLRPTTDQWEYRQARLGNVRSQPSSARGAAG